MTKITTDAQAKLPDPAAVLYPDIGFRQDAAAIALWRNHGYDTGVEPFYSADQLHSYACARVAAARLASTSPAPDGFGAFVRFGWVCEGDLIFDQAEADEARDSGGDVTTLYTAAPQPVVEKDHGN